MGKEKVILSDIYCYQEKEKDNMTKQHFIRAAEMVKGILEGYWTSNLPVWAHADQNNAHDTYDRTRAVQTAEAFLMLFKEYNPRFDEQRFLQAAGLVEQPAKKGH